MRLVLYLLFAPSLIVAQERFPQEWLGYYEGTMYLDFVDGNRDSLKFQLNFKKTNRPDCWSMQFSFESKKYPKTVKDYRLLWNEAYTDGGHFYMDEQNGILIDEVLLDDQFVSFYQVSKGIYHSMMQFKDNQLIYVLTCANNTGGNESRSEPEADGTVYKVISWPAFTTQKVIAKKVSSEKE